MARQIIESGETDKVPEVFATDCVIVDGGTTVTGIQSVQEGLRAYARSFSGSRHEVIRAVEAPNMIAVEVRVTHTNTGSLHLSGRDIPPTGKEMVEEACDVVVIEAGKIKYWRVYEDQVDFLTQLGVMPNLA